MVCFARWCLVVVAGAWGFGGLWLECGGFVGMLCGWVLLPPGLWSVLLKVI